MHSCRKDTTIDTEIPKRMEKPRSSTSCHGKSLHPDEKPMYLHSFEYIVRQSLLRWWHTILNGSSNINNEIT